MGKEIEDLRAQIPDEVLTNIRTDSPRVLKKIIKQLADREVKHDGRQTTTKEASPREHLVKLFKSSVKRGEIEIRSFGGTEVVSTTLLETGNVVSIICPDFETEQKNEGIVYKAGGKIGSGIGLTGQRLLSSLPLLTSISNITGKLNLFVIYQASAEDIISNEDIENIKKSAEKMRGELTARELNFNTQFMVMTVPDLTEKARNFSQNIQLEKKEVFDLTLDREEIIRMRLGILGQSPLTEDERRREAAFDIATHMISEEEVKTMTGINDFVHFSVDSARFSRFYLNPAVAVGRNLHYKGD